MNNIVLYLKQLGFSTNEAKLYLTLLKAGPLTVAELAESAKINRTAAYSHINSLLEKGIIAKVKGSANKIAANSPDHLHYLVEQKAIQISILQEKLPAAISLLNASIPQVKTSEKQEIRYYKGKAGVRMIYADCLASNEIRSYFNTSDILRTFPENVKLFNDVLHRNSKIKMYEIVENSPHSIKQMNYLKIENKHIYKLLPPDIKLTANDILLYRGKVAIINIRDKETITGVILENRDYYNNSVQLFDLLWRFLPEPEI